MELILVTLLNGISYGLLLFLLSAGLTLIFGMMGVLNFAHASFYMLGAYFAYSISLKLGFWPALVIAPLLVGLLGAFIEYTALRHIHKHGQMAELLFTFGLSYVVIELVQLIWGRSSVPYAIPAQLDGTLFTLYSTSFSLYRGFMMLLTLLVLLLSYLLLRFSRIGLIIQAALTHPGMLEALGHNVPRMFTLVFGGGCALAGLAGVVGGNAFVTEPGMAASVGSLIFVVVVVGGLGSLNGAFAASLLIGLLQTFAVSVDMPLWGSLSLTQIAPILPYVLLILVLLVRPRGLFGTRE
ncbi:branched-chain amino acid ABC transporter permease [Glaciimonas soli]|uniref:Branched-chain amino acid ABC transporter permease n=1 Tax=Glaciimonas soli TaxID=2590999 RepID=A0A843YQW1_9BURK|nr:branched-chain amino acid ABC transporter permease [Glaciimonas soli]MQQ99902.1 branched-chain amino acid ABC transporter permease [Glaciimonas soli]